MSFLGILESVLLESEVSVDDINDAIDNHKRVLINYHSNGDDEHTGARVVDVYAYGLTKAGNPVIRAYQPYGDTTSRVPSWKFFRLDRISYWKDTGQTFGDTPDGNMGEFNPEGDSSMSIVYKVAKFGDEQEQGTTPSGTTPEKEPVYRTDAEKAIRRRGDRVRTQTQNPIRMSDLKGKDNTFRTYTRPAEPEKPELFRTDTERGLENLRKQLENPRKIDLSQVGKPGYSPVPREEEPKVEEPKQEVGIDDVSDEESLAQLRDQLGDENEFTMKDLNDRLTGKDGIYRTDTERGLENLRKQLENPRKIDLDKIPRR